GAAAAYYLAKAGCPVTLIDRGRVGGAASHGNCGYVCPSHVLPLAVPGAITATLKTLFAANSPLKIRPAAVLGNLGWFLGFARRCNQRDMLNAAVGIHALLSSSRSLFDSLIRDENFDCEWDPVGLLFVFASQSGYDHYADTNALIREHFGVAAKRLGAAELLAAEPALKPGAAAGAWLYENDAQLRPDRLMTGLRGALDRLGVTIHENREFTGFAFAGRSVTAVHTDQGDLPCSAAVVATGAWTPLFAEQLGAKIPIVPGKGYSVTMPRPRVCPTRPMIFEEHRVAVSPFRTGLRVGSTMEFAGYDDTLDRSRLQLLHDAAAFYLREPRTEPIQEEWWGWRPMVYDGNPVIDAAPRAGNVIIAAGHGMLGLSSATGTGKLVAELVTGTPPHIDPGAYSLARFV
ncbi:MAG: NAD(P)/FAD-dependent oxidoreductase, partial [Fimbriiglobus sp.]